MADKILTCVVEKDALNNVIQYTVSYDVEYETAKNNFCVGVKAEEMTDSSSQEEAITKANVKAKIIKDAWIAVLPSPISEVLIFEAQDVTL
jgi:hypothetical protein